MSTYNPPSAMLTLCLLVSAAWLAVCKTERVPMETGMNAMAAYTAELEEWQEARTRSLKSPTGWLNLAGLYWLKQGVNTVGSAAGSDVLLPEGKAPAVLGRIVLDGDQLRLSVNTGVDVRSGGERVTDIALLSDAESAVTELEHGSLRWYIIKRGERYGLRLRDLESPLLRQFAGIDMFPADTAWRVVARFEAYQPPKIIEVPNVLGTVSESECPGALVFTVQGREYRLEPTQSGKRLFLVFGDKTNGLESYGGGRFLIADAPDDQGQVTLDFNKAYNPPCAFTPYATCPLPPEQNKLPLSITAGEKRYGSGEH